VTDVRGELYDGQTSAHQVAILAVSDEGELTIRWEGGVARYLLVAVTISDRLGNTPRYISLPDGRKFESRDNDAIDVILRAHRQQGWNALVHRLESRWGYVLLALVVVIAFVWGMLKYALPAAAEGIAYQLPPRVTDNLSRETLKYFDKHVLAPSELAEPTRQRLQQRFTAMTAGLNSGHKYMLVFRKGGERIGANAFALPSGTVVMTDELVKLAQNDEQIEAILAHELGHVVYRHGLRQILQHSVLTLFITYATGDPSSLVVALPTMLVQLGYSRQFERQADQYAHDYLLDHHIPLKRFATILTRIEQEHRERSDSNQQQGGHSKIFEYLSTHPDTDERIQHFLEPEKKSI